MVEMTGILSLAVETCRPAVEARSQRLSIHLAPATAAGVWRSAAAGPDIQQPAGQRIQIYPPGRDISLTAVVLDGTLQITVSDNGIGIMSEALPNIFELYMQDARAVAHCNGGLGIGLAVVRDLVKAHGGAVAARSPGSRPRQRLYRLASDERQADCGRRCLKRCSIRRPPDSSYMAMKRPVPIMRVVSFYHKVTGMYARHLMSSDAKAITLNTPHDHIALDGDHFDRLSQRMDINTGKVVDKVPAQPSSITSGTRPIGAGR